MKYRTIVILAIVNFILSSTLLQLVRINDAIPNFCIIISIVLVSLFSWKHALVFASISGALQDIFLGRMLGVNLMIYLLLVIMAMYVIEILFKGNFLTPIFLVAIATLSYHFMFYIVMFFVQSTIPISTMLTKIMTEVIYNSLIGFVMYAFVFKKVNGYKLGDYNA